MGQEVIHMPHITYQNKRYPLCRPLPQKEANAILSTLRAPQRWKLNMQGYLLMRQAAMGIEFKEVVLYLAYVKYKGKPTLTWNYLQGYDRVFKIRDT